MRETPAASTKKALSSERAFIVRWEWQVKKSKLSVAREGFWVIRSRGVCGGGGARGGRWGLLPKGLGSQAIDRGAVDDYPSGTIGGS
jgi:hypothetical protein